MGQKPQQRVVDRPDGKDNGGHDDGDGDDHKEEAGPAPGVVPGLLAHVLHREGQAGLIAEDGLVLRPVVLKDPVDVLHPGAQGQIPHENGQLQQALRHVPHQHGVGHQGDRRPQQGGQQEKQADGHADAQDHRQGDHQRGHLLAAQPLLQPQLELGGLLRLRLLVLGVELRREHEGLDPLHHGGAEGHHTPDQGQAQNRVAVLDEFQLALLDGQLAVRLAHHDGLLFGAAHHDALNEGLPAAHGLESAGGTGLTVVLFFRCSHEQ